MLQDSGCFSATDVFLAALKMVPGVTLMGEAGGGGSGAAVRHTLASGITVRLSTMAPDQASGELFDGVGIHPHVLLDREASDLLVGGETGG